MEITATRIRLKMAELQLKSTEVAKSIDVNPTYLSRLRNGKEKPSLATIQRLADLFGCSVDWLLGRD